MLDQPTAEIAEEGVNNYVEDSSTLPSDESPESEAPNEEGTLEAEPAEEVQERPKRESFGKDNRWKKMQGELKELRTYKQRYSNAAVLDDFLRQNPHMAQKLLEVLNPTEQPHKDQYESEEDIYEGLDPKLADKLRKIDQLEQRLKQQDEAEQTRSQQAFEAQTNQLIESFDEMVGQDGFSYKQDPEAYLFLATSVRALLGAKYEGTNKLPSLQEVKETYQAYKNSIERLANRKLSKMTSRTRTVPPSSARGGVSVQGKTEKKHPEIDELTQRLSAALR